MSRPPLHFGSPESRYIQAVPNTSVISYNPIQSPLSNSAPVGERLGIKALTVPSGNPTGITVDNTPSKVLVKHRPEDSILQPIKSSSNSSYNSFDIFEERNKADSKDEDISRNPPLGYTNFLAHPRGNGSYMRPESPNAFLVTRPTGNASSVGIISDEGMGRHVSTSSYSIPQSLSTGPASLGNLIKGSETIKPFVLKPYQESEGDEPYVGRLTRFKNDAPGYRGYGSGYKRGGRISSKLF